VHIHLWKVNIVTFMLARLFWDANIQKQDSGTKLLDDIGVLFRFLTLYLVRTVVCDLAFHDPFGQIHAP